MLIGRFLEALETWLPVLIVFLIVFVMVYVARLEFGRWARRRQLKRLQDDSNQIVEAIRAMKAAEAAKQKETRSV